MEMLPHKQALLIFTFLCWCNLNNLWIWLLGDVSLSLFLQKKVSSKEVEDLVKGERNVPLVVDFYATWCGPCILMAQELEMVFEFEISFPFSSGSSCIITTVMTPVQPI